MTDFDARARDWDKDPAKVDRARAVAAAIREQVPLSPRLSALEYGCGTGLLSFFLQPDLGPITLADSSSGMLAVLTEKIAAAGLHNLTPLRLDLAVDPLPAGRFDLIYTLMVLHHIPDTAHILQSFLDLLNPGGRLAIADLDREDGSFHTDPSFDGHKGFDRHRLRNLLRRTGFSQIHFSTCYEQLREGRRFPLFLALAEKK